MDEALPSISSGSVGSRFVSQTDLEKAQAVRDEQWKAAYARLGQEPPPRPQEDAEYDGRSLYERLASQKTAKQEKWDEDHKLSKQFRALEEDEVLFLDAVMEEKRKEERAKQDKDSEEVDAFKQAVAAREEAKAAPALTPSQSTSALSPTAKPSAPPLPSSLPSPSTSSSTAAAKSAATANTPATKPKPASAGKKDQKTLLKGIVKKKSAAAKSSPNSTSSISTKPASTVKADAVSGTKKRGLDDTGAGAESPAAAKGVDSSTSTGASAKRAKTEGSSKTSQ